MREERVTSGRPGIALAGEGRPAGLALRYPKDPWELQAAPVSPGAGSMVAEESGRGEAGTGCQNEDVGCSLWLRCGLGWFICPWGIGGAPFQRTWSSLV